MAKQIGQQVAQGDILIERVEEIPPGAAVQRPDGSVHIVTHSETGHHHVVEARRAERYVPVGDPMVSFLKIIETVNLEHLRSFDKHEAIELPPGCYKITRQRETGPEGWRRVED